MMKDKETNTYIHITSCIKNIIDQSLYYIIYIYIYVREKEETKRGKKKYHI